MKRAGPFEHIPLSLFCRFLAAAGVGLILFCLMNPTDAAARDLARLQRVEVRQQTASTRIDLKLDREVAWRVLQTGSGLRLTLKDTDCPLYRRLTRYGDVHVVGIRFLQRGSDLQVVIGTREAAPSLRVIGPAAGILTVTVGRGRSQAAPEIAPGREPILAGAARVVADFDPPLNAVIPFVPTDAGQLQKVAVDGEVRLFQRGESFLYKEMGAEAAEIFAWFTGRETPLRPLAWYRQGEALYLLGKYDDALKAFREGERRWPAYLILNPATAFYFADTVARTGDPDGGRKMLAGLIARLADKTYAPLLLDRLADVLARKGREKEALAIYRTVVEHFPRTEAAVHAQLKLADRRLFSLTPDTYLPLADQYRAIYCTAGEVSLRDDSAFKGALTESLYGKPAAALAAMIQYEKQYPQGIFVAIARSIHQELLLLVYRELYQAGDNGGLIAIAQQNLDYLARCFSDEIFAHRLAAAFSATGRPAGKVELFNQLVDRDWAAAAAPFLYGEIVDTSLAMGNPAMADLTAANFLRRFPRHPDCRHMLEHRGEIAFMKKDMPGAVAELSWLLKPREEAGRLSSYYYLGKALTGQKDYKRGAWALGRYVEGLRQSKVSSPLAGDAYFTLGAARRGMTDYRGAMAAYVAGLEEGGKGMKEQFLCAMGEMALQMKNYGEARDHWSRVLKEGTDPVWRRMAEQGLGDLEWREKIKELEVQSNK
ncbi:tetratricopeptide repeat protein [Geotalea sp. SG265]|uniref:tetratricopeptide repeat protein n=1 Tax=Geotalea sp. SG265 TaxID=2922867 RepID=UPI001FAEC323|nr:tetratricopeptide repeat protein [Geotalea sp. SG265]